MHENEQNNNILIGRKILDKMSVNIKEEIICANYLKILNNIPFFKNNFST